MKAFKFKLETALNLRSFAKRKAAVAMAAATARRIAAIEHLDFCENQLTKAEEFLKPERGTALTANEMVRRQGAVAFCRERITKAKAESDKAYEAEDQCYHALMQARQEEQGLLKLKEKARETHRFEMIRQDELAMEEFITARKRNVLA